ncbi:MAG TPA: SRPBCC family protein, partial [Nocardioides sp.]|uniref:SRPBCC family protein n=1 Tax=Nocardioides sp. TaxID=35761 RepID=UPI002D80A1A2
MTGPASGSGRRQQARARRSPVTEEQLVGPSGLRPSSGGARAAGLDQPAGVVVFRCTVWYMNRFFETSRHIDAPAQQVWEVLYDVARWPEWTPTVDSVEP